MRRSSVFIPFALLMFFLLLPAPVSSADEEGAIMATLSEGTSMSREGQITLNGRSRRVVLVDQNRNGKFDDRFALSELSTQDGRLIRRKCDLLFVEADRKDHRIPDHGVDEDTGTHFVSKVVCLEGRFYELHVTPSGDRLTLKPWSSPVGYVANPNDRYTAVLYSDLGRVTIRGNGEDKHPLPVGQWKLLRYALDKTAMNKSGTIVSGRPTYVIAEGTMQSPVITVQEGKTVLFPFGPPYRAVAGIQGSYAKGGGASSNRVMLGLEIKGSGGELLTSFMINGAKPKNPTLTISDRNGQVVERANFKFG